MDNREGRFRRDRGEGGDRRGRRDRPERRCYERNNRFDNKHNAVDNSRLNYSYAKNPELKEMV